MFVAIFLLSLLHPSERFQNVSIFYLPLLNAVSKKTTIREQNTGGAFPPYPLCTDKLRLWPNQHGYSHHQSHDWGSYTFRQISDIPQHIATLCPCEHITTNSVAEQTPYT